MIDLPPEQVIEQQLVECGLKPSGFTVAYEDYLQSIEVVIKPEAGATPQQFSCIRNVVQSEIVRFADLDMYQQYNEYVIELLRPKMLEEAPQALEKMGLLENFPVRAAFGSDKLFAEALESHCGVEKGTALKDLGEGIAFLTPQSDFQDFDFDKFSSKYSCLLTAIQFVAAKGDFQIGFIGNEHYRTQEDQK